jgi:hypothetical protein
MSVAEQQTRHDQCGSARRLSGLTGVVPRREQYDSKQKQKRQRRVDLKFRVVQRKRELTANAIELSK